MVTFQHINKTRMKTLKTETIPVLWPDTLKIAGMVERKYAHEHGIPHATVLLLVVGASDSKVAVYRRSTRQSYPGRRDFFGGHCTLGGLEVPSLGGKRDIANLFRNTAIREANEELRMTRRDGRPFLITTKNASRYLRRLGGLGEFSVRHPKNVERSSLFTLRIPKGVSINPCDEVAGKTFPVRVEWLALRELLAEHQGNREGFADGADRILTRAAHDAQFRAVLGKAAHGPGSNVAGWWKKEKINPVTGTMENNLKQEGTLVILACHGVYDKAVDRFYAEHPADRPIYEAHIAYAIKHLVWRAAASPLLVISGGPTKKEICCAESESYLHLAEAMGLQVPNNVALEKFALTSIENVLFSVFVYRRTRGCYPANIDVISWEFKRKRFHATLDAINRWNGLGLPMPQINFFPVGDLFGSGKQKALEKENGYIDALKVGLEPYYELPEVKELIKERDPHGTRQIVKPEYSGFPFPF